MQVTVDSLSRQIEQALASDTLSARAENVLSDALALTGSPKAKLLLTLLLGIVIGGVPAFFIGKARGQLHGATIKEWVKDLALTNYRGVFGFWAFVGFIAVLSVAIILHALWPKTIGVMQETVIIAILAALLAEQGIEWKWFAKKRETQDEAKFPSSMQNREAVAIRTAEYQAAGGNIIIAPEPVKPTRAPKKAERLDDQGYE